MLSWNSCHKGKGSLAISGVDIALLQEVSRYGELRGKVFSGMAVFGADSSDCGIWVARHLLPAVRGYQFGSYWFAGITSDVVFISSNILDHNSDDGRAYIAF